MKQFKVFKNECLHYQKMTFIQLTIKNYNLDYAILLTNWVIKTSDSIIY